MTRRCPLLLAAALLCLPAAALGAKGRCSKAALHVHKGRGELVLTCAGKIRLRAPVTFGGQPRGHKLRSGDQRTPEGRYFICTKHRSRKFHKFLGVSYPNASDARRALGRRQISRAQHRRTVAALRQGRCPPWNTRLGGAIGIHGVKPALDFPARVWARLSRIGKLYRHVGLTDGCISVTNAVIDQLWTLVPVGTPLYIHPATPATRNTSDGLNHRSKR